MVELEREFMGKTQPSNHFCSQETYVAIASYFDQPYPSLFPNVGGSVDDFSTSSVQQIVDHCLYDTINCSRPVNNMSKSRVYTMSMLFALWNTRIKKNLLFSGASGVPSY
ncbi:unnamed protein product [Lactuca saligna]|uniref:Uncharacterized protein n=1 Tax=Lactuca saligna TaxID=75948 RepID=A0AA36E712_LACSI|nr:unnamed protein product [Lactuca saligna]